MPALRGRHASAPVGLVLTGALLFAACDARPGGDLWVASGQTDEVVRIDASDGSIVRRVSLDRMRYETDEPHAVAVGHDGEHWYATVAHGQPSFWKFDADDDRLLGRVDLPSGGAAMIALDPDGTIAYVPDYDRAGGRVGRIAAVRVHDLRVIAHEPICDAPHEAAVHPDGGIVAVACSDEIVLIDARSLDVRVRVPAARAADALAASGHMGARGARPMSVAWSANGERLVVAMHALGTIRVLDDHGAALGEVAVGAGPAQVVFAAPDLVVSANRMDGSLSVVDVVRMEEVRRVALDVPFPHGVATDGDGRAFVAYEGTIETEGGVLALELDSGAILWRTVAGRYVLGIAYRAR